ncbi:uncharacterized protein LAJ45_00943 [Morchella importuna]|uniref:uncharacterized protein n=1 Tax=Morchella importuna TaxID=1174673 RepID=UPI001E8D6B79|nr:uncharacterized protein LAJ45_00943 [Morchella importuna]KAH8154416.1 hypothetical protein LAJ45_00943 [Morchella importuna]
MGSAISTMFDPPPPPSPPLSPLPALSSPPPLLRLRLLRLPPLDPAFPTEGQRAKVGHLWYDAKEVLPPWQSSENATAAIAARRERLRAQANSEPEAPPIGPTVGPQAPVRRAVTQPVQKDARLIQAVERRCRRLESLLLKMMDDAAAAPRPTIALMQLDIMAKSQALARQRFISRVSEAWAQSPQLAPRPVPVARATRPCPGNWLGLSDLLEALPSLPSPPPVAVSAPVPSVAPASLALVLWQGHRIPPALEGPVSVAAAMLAVLQRVSEVCTERRRDEYTGGASSARQLVRYQEAAYYRSRALFRRFLLAVARREVRDARERSRRPPRPRPYRVVIDVASGGGHGVVGPDDLHLRMVRQFVLRLLQDQERRFVHLGSVESDSDLDPLGTGEDEEEMFALAVGTPLPDEDWPVVLYKGMAPAVGHVQAGEGRAVTETRLLLIRLYDAFAARQRVPGCVVRSRVESDSALVLHLVGAGKEEEEETLALAADTLLPDEDWPLVLYRPSSSVPAVGVIAAEEVGAVETRPMLLLTWPYENEVVVQGSTALSEVTDLVEGSPSGSPGPSDISVDCNLMDTAEEASVSEAQGESEAVGAVEEPAEAPLADALPEAPVQRDEDLPEAPVPVLAVPMTDSSTADSQHTAAHADTADVSRTADLPSARPAETTQTADPQTAENTRTTADTEETVKTGDASTVPEAPTTAAPAAPIVAHDQPAKGSPLAATGRRTVAPRPRRDIFPLVPAPSEPGTFFPRGALYGVLGRGAPTEGRPTILSQVIGVSRVGVFPPTAGEAWAFQGDTFGTPTPFVGATAVPAVEEPRAPEVLGMSKSIWAVQSNEGRVPEAPVAPAPPPTTLPATPAVPKQPEAAPVLCRPPGTIPEVGGGRKKPRQRRRKAKGGATAEEGGAEEGTAEDPAAVEDPAPVVREQEQQAPVTGDPLAKYVARLAPQGVRDALRAQRELERPAGGWPAGHPCWVNEQRAAGAIITSEQWLVVDKYLRAEAARKAADAAAPATAEQSVSGPKETPAVAPTAAAPKQRPRSAALPPATPAAAVAAAAPVEGPGRNATPASSTRRSARLAANAAREEVGTIGGGGLTSVGSRPVTNPASPAIAQPSAAAAPTAGRQVSGSGGGGGQRQETREVPHRGDLGASRGSRGQGRAPPRPTVEEGGEEEVRKGGRPRRRRH